MTAPIPDLTLAPVVIRQARSKAALLTAVSLAFVAIGVWMTLSPRAGRDGSDVAIGAGCAAFFGLCAAVGCAMLAKPGRLVISPDGLTQYNLWREHRWAWKDVADFRVWRAHNTALVTFDDAAAKPGVLKSLNAGLGAGSASLAPQWALKAEALADLLNEAKARWG